MNHAYFVLSGKGGELDRTPVVYVDEDQLNDMFGDWVEGLIISVGDTITVEAA
jgi:hypothetical protein